VTAQLCGRCPYRNPDYGVSTTTPDCCLPSEQEIVEWLATQDIAYMGRAFGINYEPGRKQLAAFVHSIIQGTNESQPTQ